MNDGVSEREHFVAVEIDVEVGGADIDLAARDAVHQVVVLIRHLGRFPEHVVRDVCAASAR